VIRAVGWKSWWVGTNPMFMNGKIVDDGGSEYVYDQVKPPLYRRRDLPHILCIA